ncbi:MAG: hypothetical protein Q9164_006234 [Protoblastenia rupestris]
MGSRFGHQAAAQSKPQRLLCRTLIEVQSQLNANAIVQINFTGRPFYMMGILGFKVALCFAYLRIMKASTHSAYKAVTWTVMITCIIGHLVGTLVLIFQCSPVQRSWRPRTPGSCLPNDATFYGLAAVTILFDVIIFLLPIPLLLHLNISKKKRFALVCVFLLGLLTTVCSILRMVQIITIARTGNSTMLVLWGVVELNVGVSDCYYQPLPLTKSFLSLSKFPASPSPTHLYPMLSKTSSIQIILTCIPTLGPLFPHFRGTIDSTPSKSAYPLSSLTSRTRSHHHNHNPMSKHTSHHIPPNTMGFDKYGERTLGTEFVNVGVNARDGNSSGSSDDMVRLKDHAEGGGMGPGMGGRGTEDILKTTEVRVSVDEGEKGSGLGLGANVARAW